MPRGGLEREGSGVARWPRVGTPGPSGVRGPAVVGTEGDGGVNFPASFQCARLALSALRAPLGPAGTVVQEPLGVTRGRRWGAHGGGDPPRSLGQRRVYRDPQAGLRRWGRSEPGTEGGWTLGLGPRGRCRSASGQGPSLGGSRTGGARAAAELWTAAGPSAAPSAWSRSASR